MKIPEKGKSREEVLAALRKMKKDDLPLDSGKMFGHAFMTDDTRELLEQAFTIYLWENALDPTLFPSLSELENQVVSMAADHLHAGPGAAGNFTSGGTESIILAVKAARDKAFAERPGLVTPEVALPLTAHAAFHKACQYLAMKPVVVDVDPATFRATPSAMEAALTDRTALVVVSAPSYAHGVVDPVVEIAGMAGKRGIPCHVDACMGGFLFPFYRELGRSIPDFDFKVPGVTSISMDFHKYAFAPKGASVVVYRDRDLRRHQVFAYSGWTGYTIVNPTVQSSRSGGSLAATWAALNAIGRDGYLDLARALAEAADKVIAAIDKMDDLYVLGRPDMCIFSVGSDTIDIFELVDEMRSRGWHIQAQFGVPGKHRESFHLTIVPPNVARVDEFIEELKDAAAIVRKKPLPDRKALAALAAKLGEAGRGGGAPDLASLLSGVGISGAALPKRMAGVNALLNLLPPELADSLFISFYNEVAGKLKDY